MGFTEGPNSPPEHLRRRSSSTISMDPGAWGKYEWKTSYMEATQVHHKYFAVPTLDLTRSLSIHLWVYSLRVSQTDLLVMVVFALASIPEKIYRIQSANRLSPPLYLERQSNGEIKPTVLDTANTNQQWRIVFQDDGTYRILNVKTYEGLCLLSWQEKDQTCFRPWSGGPQQVWTFDPLGNTFIIGDPATASCLEIQPNNWVMSQVRTNAVSQRWILDIVEPDRINVDRFQSENLKPDNYQSENVKEDGSAGWKQGSFPSKSRSTPARPPRLPPVTQGTRLNPAQTPATSPALLAPSQAEFLTPRPAPIPAPNSTSWMRTIFALAPESQSTPAMPPRLPPVTQGTRLNPAQTPAMPSPALLSPSQAEFLTPRPAPIPARNSTSWVQTFFASESQSIPRPVLIPARNPPPSSPPSPPSTAASAPILPNGNYNIINASTSHPYYPSGATLPNISNIYFMRKKGNIRPPGFSSWSVESIPGTGQDMYRITGSLSSHGEVSLLNTGGRRTCRLVPARSPGCFHLVIEEGGLLRAVVGSTDHWDQDSTASGAIFNPEDKSQHWRFVPA